MPQNPLCFVLMPFGTKPSPAGGPDIDFDRIYESAIVPGIEAAGMFPIRADGEQTGGIIHKPMFERLLLCDYAVADLTTANPNVFYELGVRHAARPRTTLTIFARQQPIPFDVAYLRSLPYELGKKNSFDASHAKILREVVAARLRDLRALLVDMAPIDSPVFQLLSGWQPGDLAHLKTDVFRDRVAYSETMKQRLASIRSKAKSKGREREARDALMKMRAEIGDIDALEIGVLVDLLLTYRALNDWDGMIQLHDAMPAELKAQVLIREQLAFAYNRRAAASGEQGDRKRARDILEHVEAERGANPETCGLIGRIHKDRWKEALRDGDALAARGHLNKAIAAYLRGFRADQRDAYPGVNAVTLLEIQGDDESLAEKNRLLPVVRFAVQQRLAAKSPNYWDHATMLELSVLQDSQIEAMEHLGGALASIRERFEPRTTADNLRMIEVSRRSRGIDTTWLQVIIDSLDTKAEG